MREPTAATHPDPIPPVHVLEAAQDQEKKETEDLLAGFDRPGRGPTKPVEERDFVEYFTKKSEPRVATPGPGAVRAAEPARPKQAEISTVVVPRDRGKPGLGTWLTAGAVMVMLAGAVAFFATKDDPKTTPSVGAATTITNASPPPTTRTSNEDIPPPPPASEVSGQAVVPSVDPTVEPPSMRPLANVAPSGSGPKKRDPKGPASGTGAGTGTAATTPQTSTGAPMVVPSTKPPPRDDLIRGM